MDNKNPLFSRAIAILGGDDPLGDAAALLARELGRRRQTVTLYHPGEAPAGVAGLETVTVRAGTRVKRCHGGLGRFEVEFEQEGGQEGNTIRESCGVLVLATGSREVPLEETYGPLPEKQVVSCSRFLRDLEHGKPLPGPWLVMILGLAGNHSPWSYGRALAGLRRAQEAGKARVIVVTDQVRVAAAGNEKLYRELREEGALFFKVENPRGWSVRETGAGLQVEVFDATLRQTYRATADLLVLEERRVPAGDRLFWSPRAPKDDRQGFVQEAHAHLAPAATNRKGIFTVGSCGGWTTGENLVGQAEAAALEIELLLVSLEKGEGSDDEVAEVEEGKCALCLTCIRFCPRGAISYRQGAQVSPADCDGCGICREACPAKAIKFSRSQP